MCEVGGVLGAPTGLHGVRQLRATDVHLRGAAVAYFVNIDPQKNMKWRIRACTERPDEQNSYLLHFIEVVAVAIQRHRFDTEGLSKPDLTDLFLLSSLSSIPMIFSFFAVLTLDNSRYICTSLHISYIAKSLYVHVSLLYAIFVLQSLYAGMPYPFFLY